MGRTSSAVKRRYNEKVYKHINVALPKDLVDAFKSKCERDGVAQAAIIKEAIERYCADKNDDK